MDFHQPCPSILTVCIVLLSCQHNISPNVLPARHSYRTVPTQPYSKPGSSLLLPGPCTSESYPPATSTLSVSTIQPPFTQSAYRHARSSLTCASILVMRRTSISTYCVLNLLFVKSVLQKSRMRWYTTASEKAEASLTKRLSRRKVLSMMTIWLQSKMPSSIAWPRAVPISYLRSMQALATHI